LEKTVKVQDDSDMLLIKALKDSKVPVLAICRGAQLTNVAFGGTLYQDLPSELKKSKVNHRQSQHKSKATHSVKIKEGSEFSKILSGATQVDVNTFHHQAANKVGKGLIVVAESEDGVIEGLESRNGQWICPQFHPEGLAEDKNSIMIRFFEHLIERAK
ncbi:MAG: gamma-glutamyl-gamma-aminobutyrate hydrolase family protein, partial [Rikenellaceae bacterium]